MEPSGRFVVNGCVLAVLLVLAAVVDFVVAMIVVGGSNVTTVG